MANLYSPSVPNDQILQQVTLRHKKINCDYEYTSAFPHVNQKIYSGLTWQTIDFTRASVATLPDAQGIYMFIFNPYKFSMAGHNAEIIFYIGQADSLLLRISKYFYYPNSKKASDQDRRTMILLWGDYLQLRYCQTGSISASDLDNIEYGLIDSIIPPFNRRFRSEIAQAYRNLI